jgi:catechol 2,3-dioxygenase-like lactoylglutathione lyase family enzyme
MIRRIHHVQITIPPDREAEARRFYLELLGLREIEKPKNLRPTGFWVQVGDRSVHVSTENGVNRLATRAHVAYEVSDLDHWRARVSEAGFTVEDQAPFWNVRRFHLRDPFGNQIELLQQTSPSPREGRGQG